MDSRPSMLTGALTMPHRFLTATSVALLLLASIAVSLADSPSPAKSTKGSAAAKAKAGSKKPKTEATTDAPSESADDVKPSGKSGGLEQATFGSGCFWCSEAVFQRIKGVESVMPGYSGGHVKNPTYEQVSMKTTGHAEVVQITYDPSVVSYKELLEIFWKSHDPTKINKQGLDKGPQYRSVIFYHDDEQKKLAEFYKKELDKEKIFSHKIVTEISPFKEFYPAEAYHVNYFNNNPNEEYCETIIGPKVNKIKRLFKDKVIKE
jgi:peptide-methionine (S)-S-oxide reductase